MKTFIVYLFVFCLSKKERFYLFPPCSYHICIPEFEIQFHLFHACQSQRYATKKRIFPSNRKCSFQELSIIKCFHSKKEHLWIHHKRLVLDDFTWFIMLLVQYCWVYIASSAWFPKHSIRDRTNFNSNLRMLHKSRLHN